MVERNRSEDQAYRWYLGFYERLESLSSMPQRCPLARENDRFTDELRELHYSLGVEQSSELTVISFAFSRFVTPRSRI